MTARTGVRSEYAKSAERREEILRAALEVFGASGYRSGSVREIANRVGMSQAGLLHHFANKSSLLRAVLERRDEDANAQLRASASGADQLRAVIEVVAMNKHNPGLIALHTVLSAEATSTEHPAHEYFKERYAAVVGLMVDTIARAVESGEARGDVDPRIAARTVIALIDGLQMQWLMDPISVDMVTEVRNYVQSLLVVEL